MHILFAAALLTSAAQEPPTATTQAAPTTANPAASSSPAKRICKTIPTLGSRLAKKRFCGTREEWAERQLEDRQAVEKVQMGPCVVNGTTCK